jgi:hypothetical protein
MGRVRNIITTGMSIAITARLLTPGSTFTITMRGPHTGPARRP